METLLNDVLGCLTQLSDSIAATYFTHAVVPQGLKSPGQESGA